jgi:hypothetical protein
MSRSPSRVPYLRVIRSPRYFPLWLGQLVSNLGDTLNYVALVVLVFRLGGSGLAVSALVLSGGDAPNARAPRSGRSLAEYARRSLFLPLGMTQTRFQDDHTTVVEHSVTCSVSDDQGTFHVSLPWYNGADTAGLAGYAKREP